MEEIFNLDIEEESLIISKGDNSLKIEKSIGNDIYFSTTNKEAELLLNYYSEYYDEWQSYLLFQELIYQIVGKYVFATASTDEYSTIPSDFIDIENRTITCHSDGTSKAVLKLTSLNNQIKISLSNPINKPAKVRISARLSQYDNYCKEFIKCYDRLSEVSAAKNTSYNVPLQKQRLLTKNKVN